VFRLQCAESMSSEGGLLELWVCGRRVDGLIPRKQSFNARWASMLALRQTTWPNNATHRLLMILSMLIKPLIVTMSVFRIRDGTSLHPVFNVGSLYDRTTACVCRLLATSMSHSRRLVNRKSCRVVIWCFDSVFSDSRFYFCFWQTTQCNNSRTSQVIRCWRNGRLVLVPLTWSSLWSSSHSPLGPLSHPQNNLDG